jgi:hypothetical protein
VTSEDIIIMSRKELKRLHLVKKAIAREVSQGGIAEILGISGRQVRRLVKQVKEEGETGIIHGLRGQESNRKYDEGFKSKVIELYRSKYEGFGPVFACEKLIENEGKKLSDETLRKWLKSEGEWDWERKKRSHRQWRERKGHCGTMVQMDGSHHDWLEGRGPWLVLMAYIDDATGRIYGRFYDYEGTVPAMDSFRRYVRKHGIPQSLYADKHTTYQSWEKLTVEEELEGKRKADTQFGRVLTELGVRLIAAHSPQAKGRIERLFETLQDRLVKELRLKGIKTKEDANKFLDEEYLSKFNDKFCVIAKERADIHRKVPKGLKLGRIFCIKEQRVLRNDFTVIYENKLYQVHDRIRPGKVTIEERLDGILRMYCGDKRLKYKQIEALAKRKTEVVKKPKAVFMAGKQWIPPKDHPWRKFKVGAAA